jgi:hypothetical protein
MLIDGKEVLSKFRTHDVAIEGDFLVVVFIARRNTPMLTQLLRIID